MEFTTSYILSQVFSTMGYITLGSTYFLKNRKTLLMVDKIAKKDVIMLIIILIYTAILTYVTYTNLLSLLSVLGTIAWLFSVWFKDVKIYKIIQIPTALFWLGFNTYAYSISGIITEIILFIVAVCGLVLHIKNEKKEKRKNKN